MPSATLAFRCRLHLPPTELLWAQVRRIGEHHVRKLFRISAGPYIAHDLA